MKTKYALGLIALIAVVAGLALLPGRLARDYTLRAIREATGFYMEYGSMQTDFGARTITLQDVVIRNPPDFPDAEAIQIRTLTAGFRWRDLFRPGVRLATLSLDIPNVTLVRKSDGETNFQRMQDRARTESAAKTEPRSLPDSANTDAPVVSTPAEAGKPGSKVEANSRPAPEMEIGELNLKLGRIVVRDYRRSRNGSPRIDEYELNLSRQFKNVNNLDVLAQQLAGQVLIEGGLQAITRQLTDPALQEKVKKNLQKAADDVNAFIGNLMESK